jgi:hypothetical protein
VRLELELLIAMAIIQLLRMTYQTSPVARALRPTRGQRWRLPVLCVLFLLAFGGNLFLAGIVPSPEASQNNFIAFWLITYLPYMVASVLILTTSPASGSRQQIELALILVGACALRVPLLFSSPNLSRDSWRYVWDARVFLHGYSPYVYAPADKLLTHLRDFIFANSRFRNVPTIYPPGAQYVYILSYLIVPSSLFFLKGVFLAFDMVSCVVLAKLLVHKGLDPARVLLYAWCPLPIVEFALQGHVDVITITFTLLAALAARSTTTRGRVLTGFLIGAGTLTKLYPILMLAPVVRLRAWQRDWLLVLTCLATIVIGYIPFYIQGHGQIFGFFGIYASEQGENAGIIQQLVALISRRNHFSLTSTVTSEHFVAFALLCSISLLIFLLSQVDRINLEAGTLLLFGLVLSVSSHVFPWYATTLLPWVVLLLPARGRMSPGPLLAARLLALAAPWLFLYTSITGYLADWPTYYLVVYDPLIAELLLAALIALCSVLPDFWQKGQIK